MPECDWIDDEMARRDRGQIRPLSQDQHAAINARHYPGTRASGNAALLYRLGWRYVGPALAATEIERLRAEVAELRASVVAFGAPWAASYAEQHGAPKGAFHHRHYDILAAAGARMDDFTRWVPDNER